MEIDSNTESKLEMKIAEVERKLKEEKERYDLLQCRFVAVNEEKRELDNGRRKAQDESYQWKKKCTEVESKLSKLAHEIVAEFERKERELKEKFVALAKENRDLEHEVSEWKNRYAMLQSGSQPILKFEPEGREREVKEKLRTNDLRGEREHKGRFVDEGDCGGDCYDEEEEIIQLHQHRKKKSSEVAVSAKNASGFVAPSKQCSASPHLCKIGKFRAKETSAGVAAEPAIGMHEVADETVQAYWKRAYLKNAYHKRNVVNQTSQRSYTGRFASSKQLAHALKRVETLQCNLKSCNPSFIKHMVRSHVSSGFWLGLPRKFCVKNLPTHVLEMILEDERGVVHTVKYLGGKNGLSGGWRGFALDYNLEIGDALLFELTEPTRFKVYIIKAIPEEPCQDFDGRIIAKQTPKRVKKRGRCI